MIYVLVLMNLKFDLDLNTAVEYKQTSEGNEKLWLLFVTGECQSLWQANIRLSNTHSDIIIAMEFAEGCMVACWVTLFLQSQKGLNLSWELSLRGFACLYGLIHGWVFPGTPASSYP